MAFLETHWVKNSEGRLGFKKDLKDDEMNFEDLLNSFKEEDGLSLDDPLNFEGTAAETLRERGGVTGCDVFFDVHRIIHLLLAEEKVLALGLRDDRLLFRKEDS